MQKIILLDRVENVQRSFWIPRTLNALKNGTPYLALDDEIWAFITQL